MKKILILIALVCFGVGSFAQQNVVAKNVIVTNSIILKDSTVTGVFAGVLPDTNYVVEKIADYTVTDTGYMKRVIYDVDNDSVVDTSEVSLDFRNSLAYTIDANDTTWWGTKGSAGIDSLYQVSSGTWTTDTITETDPVWISDSNQYITKNQARNDIKDSINTIVFPEPAGGYANNIYFDTLTSVVNPVYKTLTYNPSEFTYKKVMTVNSSEGDKMIDSSLYPAGVAISLYPAGLWSFSFYGSVSSSTGDTRLGIQYFKHNLAGVDSTFFTIWSNEINNTTDDWINFSITQPSFIVSPTDKMGARTLVKTTSGVNRTLTIDIGNGYGAFINTPNKIRHSQLRDLNGDTLYQHVTTQQIANWNAGDSLYHLASETWLNNSDTITKDTIYNSITAQTATFGTADDTTTINNQGVISIINGDTLSLTSSPYAEINSPTLTLGVNGKVQGTFEGLNLESPYSLIFTNSGSVYHVFDKDKIRFNTSNTFWNTGVKYTPNSGVYSLVYDADDSNHVCYALLRTDDYFEATYAVTGDDTLGGSSAGNPIDIVTQYQWVNVRIGSNTWSNYTASNFTYDNDTIEYDSTSSKLNFYAELSLSGATQCYQFRWLNITDGTTLAVREFTPASYTTVAVISAFDYNADKNDRYILQVRCLTGTNDLVLFDGLININDK